MEDRYWTVYKFCPLTQETCKSNCVNFNTKVDVGKEGNVEDIATCDYFNADCAIRYRRRDDEKPQSSELQLGGYSGQDDHPISKNPLRGRGRNKRTPLS